MTYRTLSKWFLITAFVLGMSQTMAARLKDMAVVSGQRPNQLIGYGLVVGLDGTGDNSGSNPVTGQSVITMLNSLGVSVPPALTCKHAMPPWSW
jgi:flagellar P-ring protein precursor FlgI